MKKLFGLASMCALFFLAACGNESTPAAAAPQPAPVKEVKEVIVVTPAPPVIVKKDPPAKATVITLDKSGAKVETQKVKVVLGKDN